MKKLVALLLLALMIFSFVSCDIDWPWEDDDDGGNNSHTVTVLKIVSYSPIILDTEKPLCTITYTGDASTWDELIADPTRYSFSYTNSNSDVYSTLKKSDGKLHFYCETGMPQYLSIFDTNVSPMPTDAPIADTVCLL